MKRLGAAVGLLLIAAATPASAERLIVSVSRHQVRVNSSFDGTQIVLFGSVERDAQTIQRRGPYDIVVTVTGPKETTVARRKERVLGIWVNMASRIFVNAPSYLHVLASRPFEDIAAPDRLRRDQAVLSRVREVHENGGLVASICHGPWVLISAGIVKGRHLTSTPAIKDDLVNAGATWTDEEVVVDGNLITSRKPDDLPAFCRELVKALEDKFGVTAAAPMAMAMPIMPLRLPAREDSGEDSPRSARMNSTPETR